MLNRLITWIPAFAGMTRSVCGHQDYVAEALAYRRCHYPRRKIVHFGTLIRYLPCSWDGANLSLQTEHGHVGLNAKSIPSVSPEPDARSERSVPFGARVVGCLTEPGIVCFPVALRLRRRPPSGRTTGKHYEAREGVPAALAPNGPDRSALLHPFTSTQINSAIFNQMID